MKGRRIRELTSVVQKRFKFPEGSVELYAEKVGVLLRWMIWQANTLAVLLGSSAVYEMHSAGGGMAPRLSRALAVCLSYAAITRCSASQIPVYDCCCCLHLPAGGQPRPVRRGPG